tara:strand:+ start:628 stop:2451 length:1824 start_codon:yes stop_codon:yes gene_type:complete
MCGIFAEFTKSSLNSIDVKDEIIDLLKHRGPDNQGLFINESILFGHTRLSILGLEKLSNQPFEFENYIIIFNGEIFNYKEIKALLINKGFTFDTGSDTEVLIKAYKYWGTDCFNLFNGMWSLVIYDKSSNKIIISRDRFGQKPLFYLKNQDSLYISSEFEPLNFFSKKEIDFSLIRNYLKEGGHDSMGHSFYKDIKEFPKAHFAQINSDFSFELQRYWSYPDIQPSKWIENKEFEKKLIKSVNLRLRSDVPIAVLLSGGVDSTIISAICAENLGKDEAPEAFTFTSGDIDDESKYASEVAKILSMKLNKVGQIDDYQNFRSRLSKMVQRMGRCHSSPAILNVDQLYNSAQQKGYKVVLDGQGADELLAGYKHYHPILVLKYLLNLDFQNIVYVLRDWKQRGLLVITVEFLRLTLSEPLKKIGRSFYGYEKYFVRKRFRSDKCLFNSKKQSFSFQDIFNKYLIRQHDIGLQNLLYYGDIIAMQSSIENRSPFLDHELVEYIFKNDFSIKVQGNKDKYALRNMELYKRFSKVLDRPKVGFSSYINENVKSNIINELTKSEILNWPIFSRRLLIDLKRGHLNNNKYERFIFRLFQVHLWHEHFVRHKINA